MLLREAKLIEDATNAQEAALINSDFGETVEEVANQVKKHEAFEKLVILQDKNLEAIVESGSKLIHQNHFDSPQISRRLADLQSKRKKVNQLCAQRKLLLTNSLLYAEFNRDVAEAQAWIAEKQKKIDNEIKTVDVASLEDKIKKLQKHQTFQAELTAHSGKIKEIKANGEALIRKNHKASQDIADQLFDLEKAWHQLLDEVELRGKGLEEAHDILEFNNQLDKIESWIREKEVMIQAGDLGRDYEHCQLLQRKLDDVDSDMKIDDTKIKAISALANKLAKQGHSGVRERGETFIKKWQSLQGALNDYRCKLGAASEIHLFDRDIDDTAERIAEKCAAMMSDDFGRDFESVEALLRKQELFEKDISAIEDKIINVHQVDALNLSNKYLQSSKHLDEKLLTLKDQQETLRQAKDKRRDLLLKAYSQEKFLADVKALEQWVNDTKKRMESHGKANSIAEAEAHLELHNELKAEINGRNEPFKELIMYGKNCPDKENPKIKENVKKLEDLRYDIHRAWDDHQQELTNEYDVQDFKEQVNQLNNWLATKEAFLNNDDVGDTPRAVEILLRKHNDFETMLDKQLVKVEELEEEADRITRGIHKSNNEVSNRLKLILNRRDRLLQKAKERRDTLEKSKALQQFLRHVNDVEIWLNQKIQIAADENYRDPSNLQNKIQKHATFEAEILAGGERIQNVVEEGKELIATSHYAASDINMRIDELENEFKQLLELSATKRERLNDAYQAVLFLRSLEEFELWLSGVELLIQNTDAGKDLASANNLLKRHGMLENDVQQHNENCDAIHEGAENFTKHGHFMADEIEQRAQQAITQYHKLKEPLLARRDLLESSTMLQQFTRDVDDELEWLNDREPLAASRDLGNSLTAVQVLQKKHQVLEAELASREPIVLSLVARGERLIRSDHPSADIIERKANELKEKLAQIRDLASIRRLRLQDSVELQMVRYTG